MTAPSVIIIGAGSTGAATAHDLALRGFRVTVVERGEVASGTTGRNHCLLHSGGRYCVRDQESAIECIDENRILRRIMPDCLELNGGLFVALTEADLDFKETFLAGCAACHIPAVDLPIEDARAMEPFLNPGALATVLVPDGVFEPFRLCLAFLATAQHNGAEVRTFCEVTDILTEGRRASGVAIYDRGAGRSETLKADLIVNAGGPWSGDVAQKAGVYVPVAPTAGVMVTVGVRLNNLVLNRLNKPSDGDIVVPQRATSIMGTTSWQVDDPDSIPIPPEHVERIIAQGEMLIPAIRSAPVRGIMAAARPLIDRGGIEGREISRTFECFDHKTDGLDGFVTISGGKTTTARAMAEAVSNLVCAKLGVDEACGTREVQLSSYRLFDRRVA
jgi:glycerol-3-phosphate dehydrogenase